MSVYKCFSRIASPTTPTFGPHVYTSKATPLHHQILRVTTDLRVVFHLVVLAKRRPHHFLTNSCEARITWESKPTVESNNSGYKIKMRNQKKRAYFLVTFYDIQ